MSNSDSESFEFAPNYDVRLRGIQLVNYRLFSNVETTLEPLTVIVGTNGSGKSSFIRAIATLPWTVSKAQRAITEIGGGSGLFHGERKNLEMYLGYEASNQEVDQHWELDHFVKLAKYNRNAEGYRVVKEAISVYSEGELSAHAESVRRRNDSGDAKGFHLDVEGSVEDKHRFSNFPPDFISSQETQLPCLDWPALRFHPIVQAVYPLDTPSLRIDPTTVSLFRTDGRAYGWLERESQAMWNFLYQLCQASSPNMREHKRAWLNNIKLFLPWVQDVKAVRDVTGSIRIYVSETGSPQGFHPWDLSDGTLMLLGHLAVIQSGGSIVVVDEPEAHLHPDAVERLIKIYRSKIEDPRSGISQVIIATQSPVVVRNCFPKELRVLERSGNESDIYPATDDPAKFFKHMNSAGLALDEAWLSNAFGGVLN